MEEIQACRTCIATDVKLHNIYRNNLSSTLKEDLNIELSLEDGLPQYVCGFCAALILKYNKFKQKCSLAQTLLKGVAEKNLLCTDYLRHLDATALQVLRSLSVEKIDKVTQIVYKELGIKQELVPTEAFKEEVFVFEDLFNQPNVEPKVPEEQSDDDFPFSDSPIEDNVNNIKLTDTENIKAESSICNNKSKKIKAEKSNKKKLKKDIDLDPDTEKLPKPKIKAAKKTTNSRKRSNTTKTDVQSKKSKDEPKTRQNCNDKRYIAQLLIDNEVELKNLTVQEQIDEVQARKTSENYLSCAYKCNECFKGFWKESTYDNHMLKHDPKSGSFVCEICKMRYTSKINMNKHIRKTHRCRYSCKLCEYVSYNWSQVKYHYNYHQGVLFKCEKCNKEFKIPTSYYTHMRIHHPSEHVCVICGATFMSSMGLKFHTQKSHKVEELKNYCEDCSLYFKDDNALTRHLCTASTHNKDGLNLCQYCNQCGDSFATDAELKLHLQLHNRTEDGEVTCEKCKKVLKNSLQYTFHYQKYHTDAYRSKEVASKDKKRYLVCEVCGKKYTSRPFLEEHKRIHTGEKPFPCQHCPKTFRTSTLHRMHERTHTGERPYKCPSCPKAFGSKSTFNAHSRVHSGIKPYQCTHCDKSFSQWSSQKLHVTTVHFKLPAPYKKKKKDDEMI